MPAPTRTTAPAPSGPREYTILEGDTFTSIAEEYFGDRRKAVLIAEANPGVDPTRLAIGQRIRLPAQDAKLPEAPRSAPGTPGAPPVAEAPADVSPTATAAGRYTIRRGDTLVSIAERFYGTKSRSAWQRIYDANRAAIGDDPARLKPGTSLVIPPRNS